MLSFIDDRSFSRKTWSVFSQEEKNYNWDEKMNTCKRGADKEEEKREKERKRERN